MRKPRKSWPKFAVYSLLVLLLLIATSYAGVELRRDILDANRKLGHVTVTEDVNSPTLGRYYYVDNTFTYGNSAGSDIPKVSMPNQGRVVTYTAVSQVALDKFNELTSTDDSAKRNQLRNEFLRLADTLQREVTIRLDPQGTRFAVWEFSFANPWFRFSGAPWVSSLTSGEGLSVVLRAYQMTGESRYLETAKLVVAGFKVPVNQGGFETRLGSTVFFEEVPSNPPTQIFNGNIFALWGLYDYYRVTGDSEVKHLFDEGVSTVVERLPVYDAGYWTHYDSPVNPWSGYATVFYQRLHSIQLKSLYYITGDEEFAAYARKWEKEASNPISLVRYTAARQSFRIGRVVNKARFSPPSWSKAP